MLVYVSGLYSKGDVKENIRRAEEVAVKVWESGNYAICPHLNTTWSIPCSCTYDDYIAGDLDMVSRCDALVMIPGWQDSKGANIERDYAISLDIPIYEYPNIPEKHLVESRSPNQSRTFREIIMKMYRTHLNKNADYSPNNILATGEIGLVTRLWDKIARLLNLYGFQFTISEPGVILSSRSPLSESIDDSLLDAAVYSVIGLLLRKGQWGI